MSKVITSPVKKWAGTVTLADPLTLPQAEAIEAGLELPKNLDPDGTLFYTVIDREQLPAIFACVEKWELSDFPENPTLDNFPFSPRGASHKLIEWLFGEIRMIYVGDAEVPNE